MYRAWFTAHQALQWVPDLDSDSDSEEGRSKQKTARARSVVPHDIEVQETKSFKFEEVDHALGLYCPDPLNTNLDVLPGFLHAVEKIIVSNAANWQGLEDRELPPAFQALRQAPDASAEETKELVPSEGHLHTRARTHAKLTRSNQDKPATRPPTKTTEENPVLRSESATFDNPLKSTTPVELPGTPHG